MTKGRCVIRLKGNGGMMAEVEEDQEKSRRRSMKRFLIVFGFLIIGFVGYNVLQVRLVLARSGEAYAAWDTGTLLVEYMHEHDRKWPSSWEDLFSIMDGKHPVFLRGTGGDDYKYALGLPKTVSVDWNYDTSHPEKGSPVTRRDGKAFTMLWESGDPNQNVRNYLTSGTRDSHGFDPDSPTTATLQTPVAR